MGVGMHPCAHVTALCAERVQRMRVCRWWCVISVLRSLYIFVEELRVFLYGVCPCTWCFFVVVVRSGHSFGMNARGVVLAGRRGCVSLPAIKLGACTYMKFGWRYSLYFVMCVWIHSQSLCLCLCTCPLPDDRIGVFAA